MRLNDILNEMPVASFDTVGELGQTSKESKGFNMADWKVTHSQKAIAKIYRIFEKTPFLFNVDLGEMPDADYDKINAYVDAAEGHLNNCMEMVLKSLVGTIVGF